MHLSFALAKFRRAQTTYTPQTLEIRIFIRANSKQRHSREQVVKDVMIANFACCTPEHTVQEAAEMMLKHDCGEIAVVESAENLKPIGMITDRDITWRVVAIGKSPGQTTVRDAM
jgi:CBS domain-containing protein